MIVLAITVIIVIILLLGITASYFSQQNSVEQVKEESNIIQNQRIKEDLNITFNDGTNKTDVANDAVEDSKLTGIMIRCDDGTVKTDSLSVEVQSGGIENMTSIREAMRQLEQQAIDDGCITP